MFTREDYDNYFEQIARVERKMVYGAYELGREINDPSITRVLEKIGDDEVRHYGYILKMLREIEDPKYFEKRRAERAYALGTILLRCPSDKGPKEAPAYCVNLSKIGICLEGAEKLSPGVVLELKLRLLDGEKEISCMGKVVWSKEVEANLFISGIEFEP